MWGCLVARARCSSGVDDPCSSAGMVCKEELVLGGGGFEVWLEWMAAYAVRLISL